MFDPLYSAVVSLHAGCLPNKIPMGCLRGTIHVARVEGVDSMEDLIIDLKSLAEQGDPDAQFKLGFLYANGLGIAKDDQEAIKWFGRSAEQGNAGAEFQLKLLQNAQES